MIMAWGMPTFGISPLSQAADFDRNHAELVLNACVYKLRADKVGLAVEGELVWDKPAQGLLESSAGAALVVIGNRTRKSISRIVLGSVSSAVVTHAEAPVVLVRDDEGKEGSPWRTGAVVVGVDGSAGSEAAVDFAMDAAVLHGMSLVAVHIVEEQVLALTGPGLSEAGGEEKAQRSGRLGRSAGAGQSAWGPPLGGGHRGDRCPGNASDVIIEAGEGAALTVVGSRGHGGFKGALLGSVSRAVIESVGSPVVAVVRPEND